MAPKKQKPLPKEQLESKRGITFSFQTTENELEPVVHHISSSTLLHRIAQSDSPKKKRKISQVATNGECQWCHAKKTAQWRRGPNGSRSLCNRCGIEWAKQIKQEAKLNNITLQEAEERLVETFTKDT